MIHTRRPNRSSLRRSVLIALLGSLIGLAWAQAVAPTVQVRFDPTLGHYLTGPNGMSLYVFSNDEPGVSNCYEQCAVNWPPLLIEGETVVTAPLSLSGVFATTERSDGSRQVTYNGWPLYTWVNDAAVGDTSGQGVGDVWWLANLNPSVVVAEHPEHGPILVGPTGMTLYLFTNDEPNVTNCYEGCAFRWPPLVGAFNPAAGVAPLAGEGVTGELGLIERDDGGMQVTYNGQPLYYWINDTLPGDATGQNVGEVWFVLAP